MVAGALVRAAIGEPSTVDFYLGSFVFVLFPDLLSGPSSDLVDVLVMVVGLLTTAGVGAIIGAGVSTVASRFTDRVSVAVVVTVLATAALQVVFGRPVIVG